MFDDAFKGLMYLIYGLATLVVVLTGVVVYLVVK